jgi:16S rRNA (guanine527-N7)-methyltransferase
LDMPIIDIIHQHFSGLSQRQTEQFAILGPLYSEWNSKVNVISRKDIGQFYLHHVLHSLAIAHIAPFEDGTAVLDVGTGGGFPGIPLAIMFPECRFTLVDSIGKKIKVVEDVANRVGLDNVTPVWGRMEDVPGTYDVAVSRAVAPLADLAEWLRGKVHPSKKTVHGLLCLKGGDLTKEITDSRTLPKVYELNSVFKDPYFEGKKLLWVAGFGQRKK